MLTRPEPRVLVRVTRWSSPAERLRASAVEGQVIQPDLAQVAEAAFDLREDSRPRPAGRRRASESPTKERGRRGWSSPRDAAMSRALDLDGQRLGPQPGAVARRAGLDTDASG